MAYRNKTYVCFDGDEDMKYYRTLQMWSENDSIDFDFYDAHDLNTSSDDSKEESIKKQLKERLKNTSGFIVLIGEKTKNLYKFVRWEMEQALSLDIPIIAVNINGKRQRDLERCPPIIKEQLAVHVSFNSAIIKYALDNWPSDHKKYKKEDKIQPYHYVDKVYKKLGLDE